LRIAIDWKKRGRELALLAAVATFLSLTGTYGISAALGWPRAGAFWLFLLIVGASAGEASVALYYRGDRKRPFWLMFVIVSLSTALAVFCALLAVDALIGRLPRPRTLPAYFFAVWVVAAAMTALGYITSRAFGNAGPNIAAGPDADADRAKKFLERLPLKYRAAELWAVSSEDHYLRVHTSLGTELILMRLADAIRELDGADGLQVHRSWWVARSGVKGAQQDNGRITLLLQSDLEVPVSRTFNGAVRNAKLI
jgi:hypothetical protein